jgi:hypothetical protein
MFMSPCASGVSATTNPATNVTGTRATLNGAVTDIGLESSAHTFFRYGVDSNLGSYTRTDAGTLLSAGVFDVSISSLTAGTTYYYQACATTGTGDACGMILSFVPEVVVVPEVNVATTTATHVAATSATLNGAVVNIGLEPSVNAFFRYGTESNLGTYTRVGAGTLLSAGVFGADVSSLTTGTTYYYQACVTTGTGDVCGEILSFLVLLGPCPIMSVATAPATGVTTTSATLNGALTGLGGEPSADVFFKYATQQNLSTFSRVNAGSLLSAGAFYANITGLAAGTYYFQACAATATREVCDGILSFVPGA